MNELPAMDPAEVNIDLGPRRTWAQSNAQAPQATMDLEEERQTRSMKRSKVETKEHEKKGKGRVGRPAKKTRSETGGGGRDTDETSTVEEYVRIPKEPVHAVYHILPPPWLLRLKDNAEKLCGYFKPSMYSVNKGLKKVDMRGFPVTNDYGILVLDMEKVVKVADPETVAHLILGVVSFSFAGWEGLRVRAWEDFAREHQFVATTKGHQQSEIAWNLFLETISPAKLFQPEYASEGAKHLNRLKINTKTFSADYPAYMLDFTAQHPTHKCCLNCHAVFGPEADRVSWQSVGKEDHLVDHPLFPSLSLCRHCFKSYSSLPWIAASKGFDGGAANCIGCGSQFLEEEECTHVHPCTVSGLVGSFCDGCAGALGGGKLVLALEKARKPVDSVTVRVVEGGGCERNCPAHMVADILAPLPARMVWAQRCAARQANWEAEVDSDDESSKPDAIVKLNATIAEVNRINKNSYQAAISGRVPYVHFPNPMPTPPPEEKEKQASNVIPPEILPTDSTVCEKESEGIGRAQESEADVPSEISDLAPNTEIAPTAEFAPISDLAITEIAPITEIAQISQVPQIPEPPAPPPEVEPETPRYSMRTRTKAEPQTPKEPVKSSPSASEHSTPAAVNPLPADSSYIVTLSDWNPKSKRGVWPGISPAPDNGGLVVLSLCSGISGGLVALKQLGVKIRRYYSCELDPKIAMVASTQHRDLVDSGRFISVQGDASLLSNPKIYESIVREPVDLIIASPPCQTFSGQARISSKGCTNLEDERGLLFPMCINIVKFAKKFCKQAGRPEPFVLFENVVMDSEVNESMSKMLSLEPIIMPADLMGPCMRRRYYWANIKMPLMDHQTAVCLQDCLSYPARAVRARARCITATNYAERSRHAGDDLELVMEKTRINAQNFVLINGHYPSLGYRNFTIVETEKVMGLPQDYTIAIGGNHTVRWNLIGNGFAIPPIVYILSEMRSWFPPETYEFYPYSIKVGPRNKRVRWYPGLDSLPNQIRADILREVEAAPAAKAPLMRTHAE